MSFELPLHRSLTVPILLGGAPRSLAIVVGTLAASVGIGLQQWLPGLVLWAAVHQAQPGPAVDADDTAGYAGTCHRQSRPVLPPQATSR